MPRAQTSASKLEKERARALAWDLRVRKKMNIRDIAKEIGKSTSTIHGYLSNVAEADADKYRESKSLAIATHELLFREAMEAATHWKRVAKRSAKCAQIHGGYLQAASREQVEISKLCGLYPKSGDAPTINIMIENLLLLPEELQAELYTQWTNSMSEAVLARLLNIDPNGTTEEKREQLELLTHDAKS